MPVCTSQGFEDLLAYDLPDCLLLTPDLRDEKVLKPTSPLKCIAEQIFGSGFKHGLRQHPISVSNDCSCMGHSVASVLESASVTREDATEEAVNI